MPSFDIVSEVDRMEVKNAVDQALRELVSRFDFKGVTTSVEIDPKTGSVLLVCNDGDKLASLREIVVGKLSKRGVDLRNVEQKTPDVSSLGYSRQELAIQQGLEGDKAKEITRAIKGLNVKVQASLQDRQVRVTGNKRDDLQKVISALKAEDFGVSLNYKNFRD